MAQGKLSELSQFYRRIVLEHQNDAKDVARQAWSRERNRAFDAIGA